MLVTIGTDRVKKTFACLCSRIGSIEHTLRVYFYLPLNSFVKKSLVFVWNLLAGQTRRLLSQTVMILPRPGMTGNVCAATVILIPREQKILRMYHACVQSSCS